MSIVVIRKITDWPVTQIARITDSRQRWNTSRNTTTVTAVSPTIVGVSPNSVPKCVSVSPVGVRCFSSHRSSPASASANAVRLQHLRDQQPDQDDDHPDGEPPGHEPPARRTQLLPDRPLARRLRDAHAPLVPNGAPVSRS